MVTTQSPSSSVVEMVKPETFWSQEFAEPAPSKTVKVTDAVACSYSPCADVALTTHVPEPLIEDTLGVDESEIVQFAVPVVELTAYVTLTSPRTAANGDKETEVVMSVLMKVGFGDHVSTWLFRGVAETSAVLREGATVAFVAEIRKL